MSSRTLLSTSNLNDSNKEKTSEIANSRTRMWQSIRHNLERETDVVIAPRRRFSTTPQLDPTTIAQVRRRTGISHSEALQIVSDDKQWHMLRGSIRQKGAVTGITLKQELNNILLERKNDLIASRTKEKGAVSGIIPTLKQELNNILLERKNDLITSRSKENLIAHQQTSLRSLLAPRQSSPEVITSRTKENLIAHQQSSLRSLLAPRQSSPEVDASGGSFNDLFTSEIIGMLQEATNLKGEIFGEV